MLGAVGLFGVARGEDLEWYFPLPHPGNLPPEPQMALVGENCHQITDFHPSKLLKASFWRAAIIAIGSVSVTA
jgi:hypothetical protein